MNAQVAPCLRIVIVFGPPRSGKTLNQAALKEHYKCDRVLDAGFQNRDIASASGRVMVLSTSEKVRDPRDRRRLLSPEVRVSVVEAAASLGEKWIAPAV